MYIHESTNEELQQEVLELRKEITTLKATAGKNITRSNCPENISEETSLRLENALQGGNMAWWEMDVLTGGVTFAKRKVEMLGYSPENFKHYRDFTSLVHPDDYEKIMSAMRGHFQGVYEHYETEYRIKAKSGEYIWFYDFGSVVKKDVNGAPLICTGFVYDITDKKKSEEKLQRSENMLQMVIDNYPGVIFWKDRQCNYLGCNQSFASSVGLKSPAEVVGKTDLDMPWTSTETNNYIKDDLAVMECAKAKLHIVELLRQFDGKVNWFNTTKLPLRDSGNQVIGVVGVSNDISTLKRAEQELINTNKELAFQYAEKERHAAELVVANVELAAQNVEIEEYSAELVATNKTLVFLAANLQLVHEKERVNLAREIHDGLAQLLVALKMDIGMYKKKISKTNEAIHTEEVIAEMEQLLIQVDNANKTARSIMNGLRPEQLELLGFVAAAEVHLSTFEQTHHIKCIFKNTVLDPIIEPDQALALFRILQESLNNILKHAMATRVTVLLTTIADKLVMEIRDNGIGFDVNRKYRPDSYGLIGMKERMKLLCGKLDITSKVGEGTIIRVEISSLHKCVENLN
ncbi:MAG: PAS domain S-box protein [Paludibacter sp.]|nr:PAS domain S-box protein [Paludibacter sp.]